MKIETDSGIWRLVTNMKNNKNNKYINHSIIITKWKQLYEQLISEERGNTNRQN